MYKTLQPVLQQELEQIEKDGLFKKERIIVTPQGADIKIST
jgi:glycine C-acetyltransferase